MLYTYSIEKLTGLQGIIINNIESNEKEVHIHCELERKPHKCPNCGCVTDCVHDYRVQVIKDIPSFGKFVYIHLRKRRYRCKCGKRFAEDNNFLAKYQRYTTRFIIYIIELLRNTTSFTQIARENNTSVTKVMRIFDMIFYSLNELPRTVAIDEFKGNTGGEKYNCIITDPENRVVLDILPTRKMYDLIKYFKEFPKENRMEVELFVSDMWKTYSNVSGTWLKNATQVVDKYHWIRQIIWAFERVRKEEQKKFPKSERKYFKHSRKLLLKRFDELNDEQKQQVNIMLYKSANLNIAHWFKEDFLKILDCNDREEAKKRMSEWIDSALDSGIEHLEKCAKTMLNWLNGILNSFLTPITNGFTEGCNNKIKVLKRNAYGYQNFNRFRNRILHMFSLQKQKQVIA